MSTEVNTEKSFDLFIGRKRQRITAPSQFKVTTDVEDTTYYDMPVSMVVSQRYELFIDGKLFATVRANPKRRYSRSPIRFVKPKRGRLQVHLVRKYTKLALRSHY
jgi:hypothetical protein